MDDEDALPKAWDLDAEVHEPSHFKRSRPFWLRERGSNTKPPPEPAAFSATIAPGILLDGKTLTLTARSPEVDIAGHLRALGATTLTPGYVCGPRGELRPCERLRLPWMDVGLAVDGSGVVAVDRPEGWTPQAMADVLGVAIRRRAPHAGIFGGDEQPDPAQRVVAEDVPFAVLLASSGGFSAFGVDARIIGGAVQFRRARFCPLPEGPEPSEPWRTEMDSVLHPELWSFMPWLVHPLVVREVAAWLREHTPPRETPIWTAWQSEPAFLGGPSDHRRRWKDAIRRHIVAEVWPEVGAAEVPARLWLARRYPAQLGAALRSWRGEHPRAHDGRARLAEQLTLWSAAQEVDPGETAPDRTERLAWTERHLDIAPLPLLTELAAERLRARAAPRSLDAVRDALEARWTAIVSHDIDKRESLPTLAIWDAPPALAKRTATKKASAVVSDTFLMTDALDLRLGYRVQWLQHTWTIPVPPALGASLLAWFQAGRKPPAHAGDELVALVNALAAGVHDPGRPFVVLEDGDVVVEACWRLGAMWFRRADWSKWTRDIARVLRPERSRCEPPEIHAALHVYLRPWVRSMPKGTRRARAWADAVSSLHPPHPQHEHVARLDDESG